MMHRGWGRAGGRKPHDDRRCAAGDGGPGAFLGFRTGCVYAAGEKQPSESGGAPSTDPASSLTFATLPLSFMGRDVFNTTQDDRNSAMDLADVQEDLKKIAGDDSKQINWAWYQEGYDHKPTDPKGTTTNATYVAHHQCATVLRLYL